MLVSLQKSFGETLTLKQWYERWVLERGLGQECVTPFLLTAEKAFHCANVPHFHLPFIRWLTCRLFCHALVILHNSILSLKTSHTYVTECGKLNLILNWKIYPLWTSVGRCYSCYQRRQEIISLIQLQTLGATILPCLKAANNSTRYGSNQWLF